MESIKYKKENLINFFKNNDFFKNQFININSKNNISLILNKNIRFEKKYWIMILKDKKTIYSEESNNYLDLLDKVHNLLVKYKLIEDYDIANYNKITNYDRDFFNVDWIFENQSISAEKEISPIEPNQNKTFEAKKISENELNNFKKELNIFFENISSLDYDLIFDWKWKVEVYKWGDLLEIFPYSIEFIKRFIIKYLLNYPKKIKNLSEYNKTEVISISHEDWPMVHIKISDFMSEEKEKEMEKFEEENKNEEYMFNLCWEDNYVSLPSLNRFIEDIFYQFKIKKVKWVYIT